MKNLEKAVEAAAVTQMLADYNVRVPIAPPDAG
jgi:hypothetical protein